MSEYEGLNEFLHLLREETTIEPGIAFHNDTLHKRPTK